MTTRLFFYRSDTQIIESIKNGDDRVLRLLYERNLRIISKYIRQNSGSESEAIEILQDSLVVLWEKIREGEFILKSKISTYLYAVAKKMWLQELARRKRQTDLDQVKSNPASETPIDEENGGSEYHRYCGSDISTDSHLFPNYDRKQEETQLTLTTILTGKYFEGRWRRSEFYQAGLLSFRNLSPLAAMVYSGGPPTP